MIYYLTAANRIGVLSVVSFALMITSMSAGNSTGPSVILASGVRSDRVAVIVYVPARSLVVMLSPNSKPGIASAFLDEVQVAFTEGWPGQTVWSQFSYKLQSTENQAG